MRRLIPPGRRSTPKAQKYQNSRIFLLPKDRRRFYSSRSFYLSCFDSTSNSPCFSQGGSEWIRLFSGARKNYATFLIFLKKVVIRASFEVSPLNPREFTLSECQKFPTFTNITHMFSKLLGPSQCRFPIRFRITVQDESSHPLGRGLGLLCFSAIQEP